VLRACVGAPHLLPCVLTCAVVFETCLQVGSDSAQGAGGPVMRDTITRVARLLAQVRTASCIVACVLMGNHQLE
jgi:hypothetical protein